MLAIIWYFFELLLFKMFVEALGYSFWLLMAIALVVVFLKLTLAGGTDDEYQIKYRP